MFLRNNIKHFLFNYLFVIRGLIETRNPLETTSARKNNHHKIMTYLLCRGFVFYLCLLVSNTISVT